MPQNIDYNPEGDYYNLNTYLEEDTENEYADKDDDISFNATRYSDSGSSPFGIEVPPAGQQPRRSKTVKRVKLFRGNLVLDCPVSERITEKLTPERRNDREFAYMRYSAATCDPSYFVADNYTLRQNMYRTPRVTELFIVVTLYNEDDILLGRTLLGVMKNIKHLESRSNSKTWGKDSWKKVVVCIVADGRTKINARAKALLAALGCYQDGFAKNMVNDKPVSAHIYEFTSKIGISHVGETVTLKHEDALPTQFLFCMKEHNQKKINSHRWFFQAFAPLLNPRVCVLLDAGTRPGSTSIYHLWKTFDLKPHVGGACGEIKVMKGSGGVQLLNPLVACQNFEYKMSNILDKPLESVFGFISVLPGAFSAYRYEALLNNTNGSGPLEKYFKGETLHENADAGIFESNMYLAEDRILCFELISKRNKAYTLRYVKSAYAETDVPNKIGELILQRRRWLNGSFFAALYSLVHGCYVWRSSHNLIRKLMFHVEFFYQLITMIFSWFAIGNFFLIFVILINSMSDPALNFAPGYILSRVLVWIYGACLIACFVLAFGNRPGGSQPAYLVMVIFFAFLMGYLLFAVIYLSIRSVRMTLCENNNQFTVQMLFSNSTFRNLCVSLASTYVLYVVASLVFFEPWHMLTSFVQYILLSPMYINVLNVYAFCNLHDISWGTKGDTAVKTDLGVAKINEKGEAVEMEIPTVQEEIDANYLYHLKVVADAPVEEKKVPSADDKIKDYYALMRSSVVLLWVFTNVALCAFILNFIPDYRGSDVQTSSSTCGTTTLVTTPIVNTYLGVMLWSVAILAAVRFVGSMTYALQRIFGW
ncbi:glycosyltransferase family 2 protein [Tortispora caseinolytica NRRL Y-17796]|uniref:Chitin synthase n=1 Tax=Tortispora caseinolytica NRRL Y-17796 TaxID=767744 RepID=A0A1E4TC87_9ASCO|nr:glycosyltransferase family 2 protein [Tortispora caseinolytica NRRL Y-17796]